MVCGPSVDQIESRTEPNLSRALRPDRDSQGRTLERSSDDGHHGFTPPLVGSDAQVGSSLPERAPRGLRPLSLPSELRRSKDRPNLVD